jgi:polyisoprenoid-binding protein YceI
MKTALALLALVLPGLAPAAPPLLSADPAQSSLSFVATQQGEKFTGQVKSFQATVQYAAEDLAASHLEASMDIKSIDTKSSERDQALAGSDWFDVAHYPKATFRTTAIRMTAAGPEADAELTLRGHLQKIVFPFRYAPAGSGATLDAKVRLDRRDFGLGTGEWADESVVARPVEVHVHLALRPAKP